MTHNPILDDLHKARAEILAEYDGDVSAYLRDAEQRIAASGRPIAKITQRTIRRTAAEKSDELAVEDHSSLPSDG